MSLRLVSVSLLLGLGGCASQFQAPLPQVEEASVTAAQAAAVVAGGSALSGAGHALTTAQIQRVLSLLDQAELALKERQLTTPDGRNAWAYYSEVLELIPSHREAREGLLKIADSYIDWGYAALRQGQYEVARNYLNRAAMVMSDHPDLVKLRAAIPKQPPAPSRFAKPALEKKAAPVPPPAQPAKPKSVTAVEDPEQSEFAIDGAQLRRRAPELVARLAGYADLIEARNSRVTIEAPSDADGRWLYQRLNDRREEYRIRANFRLSKQPKIRLLD